MSVFLKIRKIRGSVRKIRSNTLKIRPEQRSADWSGPSCRTDGPDEEIRLRGPRSGPIRKILDCRTRQKGQKGAYGVQNATGSAKTQRQVPCLGRPGHASCVLRACVSSLPWFLRAHTKARRHYAIAMYGFTVLVPFQLSPGVPGCVSTNTNFYHASGGVKSICSC